MKHMKQKTGMAYREKFILDRICQINDELINKDPEYKQLEKRPKK